MANKMSKAADKAFEKKIAASVKAQQRRAAFKRQQRNMAREMVEDAPEIAKRCIASALEESVTPHHSIDGYRFERDGNNVTMIRFNPMSQREGDMWLTSGEVLAMFGFNWNKLGL